MDNNNNNKILDALERVGQKYLNDESMGKINDSINGLLQSKNINAEIDVRDIMVLLHLVQDYVAGDYKTVPWRTVAIAAGGLVYTISPFDVIPDGIPGIGLLDDAGIIGAVIWSLSGDLDEYKKWKKAHETDELTEYLDKMVGNNDELRTAEIDRLANLYSGGEELSKEDKAREILKGIDA